ncbi:MAG: exo-alpha-sialidase, partial [Gemmatimonadaceae bacterium]
MTNPPSAAATDSVCLLVGTMKGAFFLWSDHSRENWRLDGPHFRGQSVYALAFDDRDGVNRILAATQSMHWGGTVRSSDDLGRTWSDAERQNVRFPAESGLTLNQIWQIRKGRADEPGVLYCGVEPAALFMSRDGGDNWSPVQGLLDHEHRPKWQPGGGGLCLHTILLDPVNRERMLVAISTGGVYRTDDGGTSWRARNHGVRAQFLPDKHPEFGQCVHKIVHHPSRPERIFLQNHWGLYRSDDWGDSWHDIANGVPSDFGFAMLMHPHDADTVFIVPIESDEFRCTPEAKLRVYRTRDAGASWEPLSEGLPQADAYETVLRDGLATDSMETPGIYFGTRSGKVFGSNDDGSSWREVADGLPSVVCVK